jgi:hypothetical protein
MPKLLVMSNLETSANVSPKSILGCCENPFATSLSLYLSTSPFSFSLVLYTHFTPIHYLSLGKSTRSHVSFLSMESISSSISLTHCSCLIASSKNVG